MFLNLFRKINPWIFYLNLFNCRNVGVNLEMNETSQGLARHFYQTHNHHSNLFLCKVLKYPHKYRDKTDRHVRNSVVQKADLLLVIDILC